MTQMAFNPGLEKNQVISNSKLCSIFKCGIRGGMRRSKKTNTLVIVSDRTTDYYKDTSIDGILHYAGMGLTGDQKLDFAQNRTLNESLTNGVKVHLFEVLSRNQYTYRGEVKLVGQPYPKSQPDYRRNNRLAWIFPVKPI